MARVAVAIEAVRSRGRPSRRVEPQVHCRPDPLNEIARRALVVGKKEIVVVNADDVDRRFYNDAVLGEGVQRKQNPCNSEDEPSARRSRKIVQAGTTHVQSICTATLRCSRLTDRTRMPFFTLFSTR